MTKPLIKKNLMLQGGAATCRQHDRHTCHKAHICLQSDPCIYHLQRNHSFCPKTKIINKPNHHYNQTSSTTQSKNPQTTKMAKIPKALVLPRWPTKVKLSTTWLSSPESISLRLTWPKPLTEATDRFSTVWPMDFGWFLMISEKTLRNTARGSLKTYGKMKYISLPAGLCMLFITSGYICARAAPLAVIEWVFAGHSVKSDWMAIRLCQYPRNSEAPGSQELQIQVGTNCSTGTKTGEPENRWCSLAAAKQSGIDQLWWHTSRNSCHPPAFIAWRASGPAISTTLWKRSRRHVLLWAPIYHCGYMDHII